MPVKDRRILKERVGSHGMEVQFDTVKTRVESANVFCA